MKLADKPCYPNKTCDEVFVGLTFRERLIIALASNPKCVCTYMGNVSEAHDHEATAKCVIAQADAIIKELESKQ